MMIGLPARLPQATCFRKGELTAYHFWFFCQPAESLKSSAKSLDFFRGPSLDFFLDTLEPPERVVCHPRQTVFRKAGGAKIPPWCAEGWHNGRWKVRADVPED